MTMNNESVPQEVTTLEDAHLRELSDVFNERARQLRKFGPQNRPPYQWFLILSEEVGEVAKECVEIEFDNAAHPHADPERYYKELTEVAAVALAAMQNFNQRRAKCFHPENEGGCSLCTRPVREGTKSGPFAPACPKCGQRPDRCLCDLVPAGTPVPATSPDTSAF